MFANKKAHYNLLRIHAQDDKESWETYDYRRLETDSLLKQLCICSLPFETVAQFEHAAHVYASPEEMAAAYLQPTQDQEFLLLFELWRRHLPDKRTVSIFCDELDHQITSYYQGEDHEELLDTLEYLQQILDDNADSGVDSADILPTLQASSCHDLEAFLYDYTHTQLQEEEYELVAELLGGFYPYLSDPQWFDYLAARLALAQHAEEGHQTLEQLVMRVDDVALALELLEFLAESEKEVLFAQLAQRTVDLLTTEGDLLDFLDICSLLYDEELFQDLQRPDIDAETALDPKDKALRSLREFFSA